MRVCVSWGECVCCTSGQPDFVCEVPFLSILLKFFTVLVRFVNKFRRGFYALSLFLSVFFSLSVCACVRAPCLMTLNDYKIVHFEHGRNGRAHSWNVGQDASKQKLYFIKSNFNLATKCPQEKEQEREGKGCGRWKVEGVGRRMKEGTTVSRTGFEARLPTWWHNGWVREKDKPELCMRKMCRTICVIASKRYLREREPE